MKSKERGLTTLQIILIVAGVLVLLVLASAAIAIPKLIKSQQAARETAALSSVYTIVKAQYTYQMTKGRGRFTDLQTLGREGMISSALASGIHDGYIYSSGPVTVGDLSPMFDLTAKPESSGRFGTGNRSYYSNETLVIYEAEGGEPPAATPQDRIPKTGSPVGY